MSGKQSVKYSCTTWPKYSFSVQTSLLFKFVNKFAKCSCFYQMSCLTIMQSKPLLYKIDHMACVLTWKIQFVFQLAKLMFKQISIKYPPACPLHHQDNLETIFPKQKHFLAENQFYFDLRSLIFNYNALSRLYGPNSCLVMFSNASMVIGTVISNVLFILMLRLFDH